MAEPEIGVIYTGKVVKTADFGAFVNFLGSRDGLVHISELQQGRVGKTTDVVNVGDSVKVKVIGFDERGKVKLSMRVVDQATGEDITEQVGAKPGRGERAGAWRSRQHRDAAPMPEGADQPVGGRVTLNIVTRRLSLDRNILYPVAGVATVVTPGRPAGGLRRRRRA